MTSSINTHMGTREWIMLVTLSILWGGSFFFIGVAVKELSALTIVTFRVALAAICLWCIAFFMGYRPIKNMAIWRCFFIMGILNNVIPFTLIVWGQTQIASGLASLLNATTPLFTVIVAGILLPDEHITPLKLIGVTVGIVGLMVMIGMPAVAETDTTFAQIAILVASISYAFAGVYGRRFKTMAINPIVTAAGQVTASTLVLLPMTFYINGFVSFSKPSFDVWIAILALAILSTALAYIIYFKLLETTGATNLLLVTLLIPVSAIVLGSLFLDEVLAPAHYAGMALIALGLSAIDGRIWKVMMRI